MGNEEEQGIVRAHVNQKFDLETDLDVDLDVSVEVEDIVEASALLGLFVGGAVALIALAPAIDLVIAFERSAEQALGFWGGVVVRLAGMPLLVAVMALIALLFHRGLRVPAARGVMRLLASLKRNLQTKPGEHE